MKEPLPVSMTISHYRIISHLGAGGMGEVWLAEDTMLERNVAIKLLPAEFTKNPDRVRRFEQEAKAVSALNHPHIITIYEIGEAEAGRFIVMELVQGHTLHALDKPCPIDMLVSLGGQIARALSATHAAGITHRDIKPENIMVRSDGYVKILDFGLARLIPGTASDPEAATLAFQTTPGTLLGTVAYMSPEQARGETVTHAADVFALGVVFFELATGLHPFKADTIIGMLHSITAQAPLTPSRVNPDIPAALEAMILRMLEKDAGKRPSAVEVDRALAELAGQSSSGQLQRPATPATTSVVVRHTVGREKERTELQSGFASALAGRGLLLCVAGEPGMGKTTLVEDFLAELAAEGRSTIARGRCSERLAGTEAYLPLLEALESLLQSGSYPAAARVMKQIAPTWYAQVMPLSSGSAESVQLLAEVKAASQERMKRELGAFLLEVARLRPLVLFFDDLHWADVSTIDLLSFLASKFDALNVLIVVTYRPSDMLLAKHPFLQIKPDLQARGVCRELALEFLNEAEIAQYLALEFPQHRFQSEFPKLIHAKTEGSPLFMTDLVRYLRDRGAIALEDSTQEACAPRWALAQTLPDIERELPESVRGMIERKIAQLSEGDSKLLVAASVQGYEFDSAVVAQVLNLEADEVEDQLEKLERVYAFVRLVSEEEFPNRAVTLRYRFVHVLYQNALYASLRVTRKTALSAAVAQSLEGFHGGQSANVANELALLWEAAREYGRSASYFLQAARNAAQINAHREAVQLARRGLEALLKLPETPERNQPELGLQLTLGLSLQAVLSWAAPEAGAAFNRAQKLCEQMGDDPRLFAALTGVAVYHCIRGEFETAKVLCEKMVQLAEKSQDPVLRVAASAFSVIVPYYRGELVLAHQQGERALALDRLEYHKAYLSLFNENLGTTARRLHSFCLWMLGYPERALAVAHEGVTLAEHTSHPFSLGGAHQTAGVVHFYLRDWQTSRTLFEKVIALSQDYALGDIFTYTAASHMLALAYQGPTEEALERAKQSIESLRAKGLILSMTSYLAVMGELFLMGGRFAEGLDAIADALAVVERTGERSWEAEIWRIKGELSLKAATANPQAEAESCYQKAIEIARHQSAKSLELRAVTSLARLWRQQDKRVAAQQMLAEVYGWFTEGFDTSDLKDAKALLDELSSEFSPQAAASGIEDKLKLELSTPSIAVLPFVNMSADAENEYFCDGLAEELLNALSKIEALRVAARTSAFSFKGKEIDIREIGQHLNVGAVLEGSVRKSGNRLRITAQLINVKDGYQLWSDRYDREMADIFDIQDEISLAIVDALKVRLLGSEKTAVLRRYTNNTDAYQLYLSGRFHYAKWTAEGWKRAIEYFERAIEKEPNYAPAFAGMASSYFHLWWAFGTLSPAQSVPMAQTAAARALEIDSTLAESHLALGQLKFWNEWDFAAAELEFKRALELNPNYAAAHEQYGIAIAAMDRANESIELGCRALELDPLSLPARLNAGWIYECAGQINRMAEQGRKMIELEPGFFGGPWNLGIEAWTDGLYQPAISHLRTALSLGAGPIILSQLGCLYGIVGERDKAMVVLRDLRSMCAQEHELSYPISIVHAGLGQTDRAFELLEQAYEQHAAMLLYLKHFPPLIPGFSTDRRLSSLLRRIGLPV